MSVDASDSRGSHCSGAPSSLIKKKIKKKPPFNLYFAKCQPVGRSDFHLSKIDAKFITPKFYSRDTDDDEQNFQHLNNEMAEKYKIKDENKNHNEKHNYIPLLSSQSYGWWHDRSLNSYDSRFNFHKNTSTMVQSNILIQWEDKKLRGLSH